MYNNCSIVRVKSTLPVKFGNLMIWKEFSGYCLKDNDGRGYLAFSKDADKYGILVPYSPVGGKKALQSILNAGGFIHLNGIEFVSPAS